MEPVIAIAKVWETVFSCGLKGCLLHPILVSRWTMGRMITKLMSPIIMIGDRLVMGGKQD